MDSELSLANEILSLFNIFRHSISLSENKKASVSKSMLKLQHINSANFYSEDEELSELSEDALSTILIPFLIAEFINKFVQSRKEAVPTAKKEYMTFLRTILTFKTSFSEKFIGFIEFDYSSNKFSVSKRNILVEQSRYAKDAISKADAISEISCEKILLLIEFAAIESVTALRALDTESEILEAMHDAPPPTEANEAPKPIQVLSFNNREEFQKKVFDLPSWCTSGSKDNVPKDVISLLADPNSAFIEAPKYKWKPETLERGNIHSKNSNLKEEKEAAREDLSTQEIENELESIRAGLMKRDDWLDTHRRGEGNRANKG